MACDPFDVLGVPARFDLDASAIERAFLRRASQVHPDAGGGDEGEGTAAALNEARAVLSDPERRANALLARLGGPAKEQDKGLPPGFLMNIMETRQQIEADLASGADGARERWRAWAAERRGEYAAKVAGMFAGLGPGPTADGLAGIRRELNAWRYIERLIEQLNPEYDPGRADW